MFYTPGTASPTPMRYTYHELRAMAARAPAHPVGNEPGSYVDSPLGLHVGLHWHVGLHSVHVIVGDPATADVPHRKLAVVEPDRTDVLIRWADMTPHQRSVMSLLPGPFIDESDSERYLFHV